MRCAGTFTEAICACCVAKFAGLDLAKLGGKIKLAIDATAYGVASMAARPGVTAALAAAATMSAPLMLAPYAPLGVPATSHGPAGAGAGTGPTVNNTNNQTVQVTVNGSGDPVATGRAVVSELDRSAAAQTRNAGGAVR